MSVFDTIPESLYNKEHDYFKDYGYWFFIKHPNLNYVSPYAYLRDTKDVTKVESILDSEIRL